MRCAVQSWYDCTGSNQDLDDTIVDGERNWQYYYARAILHHHYRHDTWSHCTPSLLTTAAVINGLCLSPIGSMSINNVYLSHNTLSTTTSSSKKLPARLHSLTPGVSIITARLMELEPEKDHWQRIACDWYAHVVAEYYPGRGDLHHHLGLLSCKAEGAQYIPPCQGVPDARAPELFVFLP